MVVSLLVSDVSDILFLESLFFKQSRIVRITGQGPRFKHHSMSVAMSWSWCSRDCCVEVHGNKDADKDP